jgi:hypothetical protein
MTSITELQITHQYWYHVECYPLNNNKINLNEAKGALIEQLSFLLLDVATSYSSTGHWTEQQCQNYLSLLQSEISSIPIVTWGDIDPVDCPANRETWIVARLTHLLSK